MDLLELGSSAATGGLLGMVGTVMGRVAAYFEARQANAHERERWQHERAVRAEEAEREAQRRESDHAHDRQMASYEGLNESLRAEASVGATYRWVNAIRALVRPVLTPVLWIVYLVVFFAIVEGNARTFLSAEAQDDFVGYFIANIAFAASAATLWWFGDRALPPRDRRG